MRASIRGVAGLASTAVVVAMGLTAVAANAADIRGGAAPAAEELLSRNKPVQASSASGCCAAKNAVDGNAKTRWASVAGKDPQSLSVDLGAVANVSRVRLQWDTSCATAYQVQTSTDQSTWTTIYTTTTGKGKVEDLAGLTGSGRYVRVLGTKRCRADGAHGYSLQEFDVYGSAAGGGEGEPPTAPGKPEQVAITANSVTVSWAAATDNVGVVAYGILADGNPCGSVPAPQTTGTCVNLTPDADHVITVVAFDAAGNASPQSESLTVHTSTGGQPPSDNPYGDPNLVSMFDGKTLNGWTQAKDGQFVVQNGTIHSTGSGRGWIYYKQQAGTFRWIFNVKQVAGNHAPTVLIWGT